ncbi:DNA/RNA polymerases family [Trichomonas vaginalis G3]|uniref:DNA/RNA polymerases family n=1 Tax=Trichomonas vaginalis (strain ATCC PRA-98 / G3) TaxID=412133 RepID=UPI0021E60F1F|nr:DNA/RNA polymerases family [Trichomonas vaginalis G3]KAI5551423.1 DNA/RNA polymerases family [Trichomonas vaginalis G3]
MDRKSARIKAELQRYGWRVSKNFKYRKGRPIKVYDKLSGLRYEVKSKVVVYYENIDALMTNEEGYNKLIEMGMVGEKMGCFKLDKVFSDFHVISKRKYWGILEDGTEIKHCMK